MCRATKCRTCGGTTWAGCGQHVDSVMAGVPKAQRCTCDPGADGKAKAKAGATATAGAAPAKRRWFSRS